MAIARQESPINSGSDDQAYVIQVSEDASDQFGRERSNGSNFMCTNSDRETVCVGPRADMPTDEESAKYLASFVAEALVGILTEKVISEVQKQLFERLADSDQFETLLTSLADRTAASVAALLSGTSPRISPREAISATSSVSAESPTSNNSPLLSPAAPIGFSGIREDEFALPRSSKRRIDLVRETYSECNSGTSQQSSIASKSPERTLSQTKSAQFGKSKGVKEAEQTIGNKLLEAMDLYGQNTSKKGRGSISRNSEDGTPPTSISMGANSALGGVAQSMRAGCMNLLRRRSLTTISGKQGDSAAADLSDLSQLRPGGESPSHTVHKSESIASDGSASAPWISIPHTINPLTGNGQGRASGASKDSENSKCSAMNHSLSTNDARGTIANMSQVRQRRTDEIVGGMRDSDEMDLDNDEFVIPWDSEKIVQGVSLINGFRLCGILGWGSLDSDETDENRCFSCSCLYQWVVFLLTLSGLGICIVQVLSSRSNGNLCYSDACLNLGLLTDIPLFVGSVFGLLSLGTYSGSHHLSECISILLNYSQREGFLHIWKRVLWRDLIGVILIWVVAMMERVRGNGTLSAALAGELDAWGVLHMIFFTISTGVLMGLTFCILFFCRAFMTMVDIFCANLVAKDNLEGAVRSWNILQAVLRKASSVIECCFFVLQTTAFATILIGVADIVHSLASPEADLFTLIPCALVTLGIATIFFSAAKVTEKCARVPSLVNSMSFGREIDTERQYVVEYINNSAAGFYVFEIT